MRIMDLDFRTAVKYAYLGDMIYRLETGRAHAIGIPRPFTRQPSHGRPQYLHPFPSMAGPAQLTGIDLIAEDWVAESTPESV